MSLRSSQHRSHAAAKNRHQAENISGSSRSFGAGKIEPYEQGIERFGFGDLGIRLAGNWDGPWSRNSAQENNNVVGRYGLSVPQKRALGSRRKVTKLLASSVSTLLASRP